MKYGKVLAAAAVASALSVGASNASANVYGNSRTDITDLTVLVFNTTTFDGQGISITGWNQNTANNANLNLVGVPPQLAGCTQQIACGPAGARIDAGVASIGTAAPANNTFALQGPGAQEYAWADSLVASSELAGDADGSYTGAVEAELQMGYNAGASADLNSLTSFTFDFTVVAGTNASMILDFDAILSQYVEIFNTALLPASALANSDVTFSLTKDGDFFTQVQWQPSGQAGDCFALTLVCTINDNDFNLNEQIGIGSVTNQTSSGNGDFGILVTGITDGDYTLELTTTNEVVLTQAVPEPGTLLLFGLGLAGLGRRLRSAA